MNIKRLLKPKFLIGIIKAHYFKFFVKNVNLKGYKYFFGKYTNLITIGNGEINMNGKVWVSSYSKIEADGGKIFIGYNTFFNENTRIVSKGMIELGNDCLIGPGVNIYDHDHKFDDISKPICKQGFNLGRVIIENNVWIGANVVITRNVKIGQHSVIAANSVVVKDVEPYSLVGGNPAMLIKKIV